MEPPREADRFAHGRTTVPRGTGSSSPWLSSPSFFLPQASTQRPQILSSGGCLDTGALSPSPSRPRRKAGIRPQAPGRGVPELAEAGIGLGRRERDWRRPSLRDGLRLFWGGATKQAGLRLAGVARGGGTLGGAELGAERLGQRDEELEEAGREMSAAAGSRERDSAGLAGGG